MIEMTPQNTQSMPEDIVINYGSGLLIVRPDGTIQTIYNDCLKPVLEQGTVSIKRASHVEPDHNGEWVADMSPVNGPQLGPFPLRQTALEAEVRWLYQNTI